MVSWGPVRADGERFYTGQKDAPAWVRDLNWKHRCTLESQGLEAKRKRKKEERLRRAMGLPDPKAKSRKGGGAKDVRMKMGSSGALVPEESDDALLERLAFAVESKKQTLAGGGRRGGGGGGGGFGTSRSTARGGHGTARSYRSTARSGTARSGRSTGRSSARSISTIGTINTEMRDIIRETASKEIDELRRALELEATLRAESDKKIDKLVSELENLRKDRAGRK
jgi:hypothetical protein